MTRVFAILFAATSCLLGATTQKHYYAHDAVADRHGVIAPWYRGQNGQLDWRVRIAAETLKRYPWVQPPQVPAAAPAYVYSGHWRIAPDGAIFIPPLKDWHNGDWGQRAAYVLSGFVDYYRYSGDPAAIAHITCQAEVLLDHCQTPEGHPWPQFPISVPVKGKPFGDCDPAGMIQLDIVAEIGIPLIRAAQLTGNERYMNAAKHWGDLFAAHCNHIPGEPPWNRYANPEAAPWGEDHQTGGVVYILTFLDELIRAGYTGHNGAIVEARDIGRRYLSEILLPRWTVDDTWGRNYWDWHDPVQAQNVTEFAARYLMENPDVFPTWKTDARNIMTLFLNRTSVNPQSGGNVYHGAWAYPESSGCCRRSLWYGPMELVNTYAQYAVLTDSAWAREMARRQMILATYDGHETGVVEDNIDGGAIVAGAWFKIAHPMALKHCLAAIAYMPETFGAAREDHIVRSTSVVTEVQYSNEGVAYRTFDAPPGTIEVLRLSFRPGLVTAGGEPLRQGDISNRNSYQVKDLSNGDSIVTLRHDGALRVEIHGPTVLRGAHADSSKNMDISKVDRRTQVDEHGTAEGKKHGVETPHCSLVLELEASGKTLTCRFTGNQVRVVGDVGDHGGLADVYLDEVKQPVGIDTWCPRSLTHQVLFYRNGLENKEHTLKVAATGKGSPRSKGTKVRLSHVWYADAAGTTGFGEGGGPIDAQRMIFGYTGRTDFIDSRGHAWRPGTEFIIRSKPEGDAVAESWWTQRRRLAITGTENPELYRYGVHGKEFNVHVTVGTGMYYARLKFAETRSIDAKLRTVTVNVNGKEMISNMDIAATAGGMYRAVNVVLSDIQPVNGMIDLRFTGPPDGEAILQALEVGPGNGGQGAKPVTLPAPPATNPR